jgi:hypothetical protein
MHDQRTATEHAYFWGCAVAQASHSNRMIEAQDEAKSNIEQIMRSGERGID